MMYPGIKRPSQFKKEVTDLYYDGLPEGTSTGWMNLDRFYKPHEGQLTIVTGVPSHGKSEFIDALTVNLAKKHDWRFAMMSPENFPLELHMSKLMRKLVGKSFGAGYEHTMNEAETKEAFYFLDEHYRFITSDDEHLLTVEDILEFTRQTIQENMTDGLVIDPWNEIDHQRS